jgi:hypothetical protein
MRELRQDYPRKIESTILKGKYKTEMSLTFIVKAINSIN